MELEALVRGAAMGDQRAWRQLTACLTPRLRGFFAARYSTLDNKDLVQDTLFVIWAKLADFEMRSEAEFLSWVYKIARCVALAALRQSNRNAKKLAALGEVDRRPETRLSARVHRAMVLESVLREADNFPESYRRAVDNMFEGGDARDLAKQAGIKWTSARVLEHRTRVLLRRRLGLPTPTP